MIEICKITKEQQQQKNKPQNQTQPGKKRSKWRSTQRNDKAAHKKTGNKSIFLHSVKVNSGIHCPRKGKTETMSAQIN